MTNEKKKLAKAPTKVDVRRLGSYAIAACANRCVCYCMSPGMGWDLERASPEGSAYSTAYFAING